MEQPITLGILQQRKIEAEIIKPIYDVMVREIGLEKAQAIVKEAIAKAAIDTGAAFAAKEPEGKTTIQSFVALQYLWEKDGALEIEVITNHEQCYEYRVTRCQYAEMYHEMGLGEIGALLSCNRDAKFIEGYAPDVQFTRPHTIMNGDGFCDFCYKTQ